MVDNAAILKELKGLRGDHNKLGIEVRQSITAIALIEQSVKTINDRGCEKGDKQVTDVADKMSLGLKIAHERIDKLQEKHSSTKIIAVSSAGVGGLIGGFIAYVKAWFTQ